MQAAALWGAEHVELGEIVTRTAGRNAAVAITRGRYMKSYRYTDPNEDVAVAVAGARGTLLVCADGHNGATASQRAVEEVVDALADDPPPGLGDEQWLALFSRVNEAVLAVTISGSPQPASRTVLLVALVGGGVVSWGSLGDASLVLARPGVERGRQLNREVARFVGYPMSRRVLDSLVQRGNTPLEHGEYVLLVTDGLSEFVHPMRPVDVVPRILGRAGGGPGASPSAEVAAAALVETACDAGAGDNVAAAVLAP